jgi:flagellar protein FlgJ
MSEISKLNPIRPQLNQVGNAAPTAEEKAKAADAKLHEVADLYENHFIREMMKQMRSTVQESGFIKQNNAEKIFREQLDDQYADQWGKSGGIGLSTMIYDQLIDKFGEQMGLKGKIEKPHGPIDLNEKANFTGITTPKATPGVVETGPETFKFETSATGKTEIKNPWAGTLLDKKYLEMDQIQYRIKHDNGLESLILTRGTGLGPDSQLSVGDEIQSGQQLGWATAASPLFWTVKANVSE